MDLRLLTGPDDARPAPPRRFGRRAGDRAGKAPVYAAPFVAQVAGLSLPKGAAEGGYRDTAPTAPTGLVTDAKV
ncbi:MAG: hypothetical protein NW200_04845 [Hyphomonadaceae bacterium]|nr:hypothetical protein [Hyphomonadaceae bacterium]